MQASSEKSKPFSAGVATEVDRVSKYITQSNFLLSIHLNRAEGTSRKSILQLDSLTMAWYLRLKETM
jgi:hypothetical protein